MFSYKVVKDFILPCTSQDILSYFDVYFKWNKKFNYIHSDVIEYYI